MKYVSSKNATPIKCSIKSQARQVQASFSKISFRKAVQRIKKIFKKCGKKQQNNKKEEKKQQNNKKEKNQDGQL